MAQFNQITFIYPYYINKGMLEFQLATWSKYEKQIQKSLRVIIVDDGSPKDPASDLIVGKKFGFGIELYRVQEDIPYNQHGARNLGFYVAKNGWCFASDIDHVLPPDQAFVMFSMKLKAEVHYRLGRKKAVKDGLVDELPHKQSHPNTYLVTREAFWHSGGYDEDFCGRTYRHAREDGCYGGDGQFLRALNAVSPEVLIKEIYVARYGREVIADASCDGEMRVAAQKDGKYKKEYEYRLNRKKTDGDMIPCNPLRFKWSRVC